VAATLTEVPEPAAASLLVSAILLLAAVRLRGRTQRRGSS
jgi:hypothetical protein